MERKRSSGFHRISTVGLGRLFYSRLGKVYVNDCPAGARKKRNITMKIQRNPLIRFFP